VFAACAMGLMVWVSEPLVELVIRSHRSGDLTATTMARG
jgi:hypothetical protein